jgi:hypothetical protein
MTTPPATADVRSALVERLKLSMRHVATAGYTNAAINIQEAIEELSRTPQPLREKLRELSEHIDQRMNGFSSRATSIFQGIQIAEELADVGNRIDKIIALAALRAPQPLGTLTREAVDDEVVNAACVAYAKATGYYVEFHKGLSSASSDEMRKGMRAAIDAILALHPLPGKEEVPVAWRWRIKNSEGLTSGWELSKERPIITGDVLHDCEPLYAALQSSQPKPDAAGDAGI